MTKKMTKKEAPAARLAAASGEAGGDAGATARGTNAPAVDAGTTEDVEVYEHTLDSLGSLLGPVDETMRAALFERVSEEALVSEGARVDSIHILDDMPLFLGSCHEIITGLDDERRAKVQLDTGIFAVCLYETLVLRRFYGEHAVLRTESAGGRAQRDAEEREETRKGIGVRDSAVSSLRNALDTSQLAKLETLVGTAETAETLATGLESVARFMAEAIAAGSDSDRVRFRTYGITPERVAALRARAAQVRAAGTVTATVARQVSQRRLDQQDGRVLFLVERILRAFRAARREDRSILVPRLRAIAWMFDTGAGRPRRGDTDQDPPAPTPG